MLRYFRARKVFTSASSDDQRQANKSKRAERRTIVPRRRLRQPGPRARRKERHPKRFGEFLMSVWYSTKPLRRTLAFGEHVREAFRVRGC